MGINEWVFLWCVASFMTWGALLGPMRRKDIKWTGWIVAPVICLIAWPFILGGIINDN